jgi:hypothetical protein
MKGITIKNRVAKSSVARCSTCLPGWPLMRRPPPQRQSTDQLPETEAQTPLPTKAHSISNNDGMGRRCGLTERPLKGNESSCLQPSGPPLRTDTHSRWWELGIFKPKKKKKILLISYVHIQILNSKSFHNRFWQPSIFQCCLDLSAVHTYLVLSAFSCKKRWDSRTTDTHSSFFLPQL